MVMQRVRSAVGMAVVVAVEAATVTALHRLGSVEGLDVQWDGFGNWLAETPTEDVLVALARVVALGVAWWLLISTAVYLAASLLRLPRLVAGVRWATLPGVRRLADGLVAGSILAGAVFAASAPVTAEPVPAPAHVYVPRPAGDGPAATTTTTTTTARAPEPQRRAQAETPKLSHRVAPGDNLWDIAEGHLARTTGRDVGDLGIGELRSYWLRLIEANRDRLSSGDPDLIYPGEELVLPEVSERP